MNGIDIVGSVLFFTLLITETCADQQQWNFQTQKYALKNAGKELVPPYDVGFLRSGTYLFLNLGRAVVRPENLRGGGGSSNPRPFSFAGHPELAFRTIRIFVSMKCHF